MFTSKPIRVLGLSVLLCLSLALLGEFTRHPTLIYIFKPLATILVLAMPLAQWQRQRSPYARNISIGLFFSLLGDIALIFAERYFLYGLLFFLLAHITYLIAFSLKVKFPARPAVWPLYLAFAVILYAFEFSNLPVTLRIPVAVYALLLTSMAAQSMGRFLILKTVPAGNAAAGALFFLLSDALLSLDRFHAVISLAPVVILLPYYLAQWFIALSTLPCPSHSRTPPL